MVKRYVVLAIFSLCVFSQSSHAQAPAKIDFGRDVLPIFRQNCVGCHGASQQINGLRLDRRSSVFRTGARRIVPGSSENSFLYFRLIGNEFGLQMPPTGFTPSRPNQYDQGVDRSRGGMAGCIGQRSRCSAGKFQSSSNG